MYITAYAMNAAQKQLGTKQPKHTRGKPKPGQKKKSKVKKRKTSSTGAASMSKQMAELIVPGCKTTALDRMYENPSLGELLQCNCSGCIPELETKKQPPKRRAKGEAPPLTKEMKEVAMKKLVALRKKIFTKEIQSASTDPFFVLPEVLPIELISNIIDRLPGLDFNTLNILVDDNEIAKTHVAKIWTVVIDLRQSCEQQLKWKADEKASQKVYVQLPRSI